MSFWRLFYHLVWATRERAPLIDGGRAELLDRAMRAVCNDKGVIVHALGMMPDHVHLVASVPPRVAIAELVQGVKGMSSHLVNDRMIGADRPFAWQAEYGVFSFAERSLPNVVAYVHNQPAHHAAGTTRPLFETYASSPPARPRPASPDPSPGGAS